jgi:hypothetical protein
MIDAAATPTAGHTEQWLAALLPSVFGFTHYEQATALMEQRDANGEIVLSSIPTAPPPKSPTSASSSSAAAGAGAGDEDVGIVRIILDYVCLPKLCKLIRSWVDPTGTGGSPATLLGAAAGGGSALLRQQLLVRVHTLCASAIRNRLIPRYASGLGEGVRSPHLPIIPAATLRGSGGGGGGGEGTHSPPASPPASPRTFGSFRSASPPPPDTGAAKAAAKK